MSPILPAQGTYQPRSNNGRAFTSGAGRVAHTDGGSQLRPEGCWDVEVSAGSPHLVLFACLRTTVGLPSLYGSKWAVAELFQNRFPFGTQVRRCRYRLMKAIDNAVTETPEMLFGYARSADAVVSFDRYQNGNRRTVWHKADVAVPVSERNDTGRTRAYTKPPNSGPGGRCFESTRPDQLPSITFQAVSGRKTHPSQELLSEPRFVYVRRASLKTMRAFPCTGRLGQEGRPSTGRQLWMAISGSRITREIRKNRRELIT